jgi:phosphoserine phosphatase
VVLTQLIIIRHGQTEWNRVERFRGRTDIDLDETGRKQAEATAQRITEWPVSFLYYSPLKRTTTAAGIISEKLKLKMEPLPGLMDMDYGKWQGLTPEEAKIKDEGLYKLWLESPQLVKFPGGESLEQLRERAGAAIDELIQKHPLETIGVVTHKTVIQVLVLHLLQLESSRFWQIWQDVAAINLFEVKDGSAYARLINDTCHLNLPD